MTASLGDRYQSQLRPRLHNVLARRSIAIVALLTATALVPVGAAVADQVDVTTVAFSFAANRTAPKVGVPYTITTQVLPTGYPGGIVMTAKHLGTELSCSVPTSTAGSASCTFTFPSSGTWNVRASFDSGRNAKVRSVGTATVGITVVK
jgi:hypothetical protein